MKDRLDPSRKIVDFTPKGREKIDEICKKAAYLFSKKGYQTTTLGDVSNAALITKAGIYHYFKTKEELLFYICWKYMNGVLEKARKISAAKISPQEKLRRFVFDHIEYLDENLHEARLIIKEWRNLSPVYYDVLRNQQKDYLDIMGLEIENLFSNSNKNSEERKLITYLLMGMCNGPYYWYRQEGTMPPEKIAEQIYEILRPYIQKPD